MPNLIRSGLRRLVQGRQSSLGRRWARDVQSVLGKEALTLLDVGASGGILPRWYPYRQSLAFLGVEPDARAIPALLESAEAKAFKSYRILPCGAWSQSGAVKIQFTRKPMCSSHFTPNLPFLSRFPEAERFDVVGSGEIECRSLDDLLADSDAPVDFIKLDLEGAELAALQGAGRVLDSCLGLHVEVCFQSLRKEQPLFGDVAAFLQQRGFDFIDFVSLCRWERDSLSGLGQTIHADALFLKGPERMADGSAGAALTPRRARAYLAILMIYERFDLALRFLDRLRESDVVLERRDLEGFAGMLKRRRESLNRHYRLVSAFGRTFSRVAGQQYGVHYIY